MTPDEVNIYLANFLASFDFTRPGMDQSLGRDMALLMAERIGERGRQDHTDEHGALGSPWSQSTRNGSGRSTTSNPRRSISAPAKCFQSNRSPVASTSARMRC